MKRTTTRISLTAALLVTSALPLAAHAGPDAYVGASIGNARLDDNFDGFGIDTDANAYRLFGGNFLRSDHPLAACLCDIGFWNWHGNILCPGEYSNSA